jgi:hypothetical protein
MSYDEFKEFHDKHPDLDNAEYYAEFPETNKSTVRSWKSRASKPVIETPEPTEQEANALGVGWDREMIKLLCTQTKTPLSDFEDVDDKSALIILKNKMRNLQSQEPKPRSSNAPILPQPNPIGQNKKKFGIDPYIVFDDVKNEIRMEIPWDVLFDPEQNRALGKEVKK